MPQIGPLELVILLVIVLLIFGPKRLPGLGRQLGSGMREFKDGITGRGRGKAEADDDAPALEAAPGGPEAGRAAASTAGSDAAPEPTPADAEATAGERRSADA
jgi:sec-independent protein translocase protein TatA